MAGKTVYVGWTRGLMVRLFTILGECLQFAGLRDRYVNRRHFGTEGIIYQRLNGLPIGRPLIW